MLDISSNISNNNNISYNKRQFWEYKRLYGGTHKRELSKRGNTHIKHNVKKNVFHLVNKKIATDKTLIKRLSAIYIPPAYKNIVVAKSENNKIQAIGTDKRGRRQYVYNSQYTKKRNDRKYEDIIELGKKIVLIEQSNIKMLNILDKKQTTEWSLPDDYIPIIIYMLRTYHFRIGNERYVNDNKTYGITTLRAEHILWKKDKKSFTIEFIGKKGILNSFSDNNPIMASLLKKLISYSKLPCNNGYLFKYKIVNNISIKETVNTNTNDNPSNNYLFISPEHIQTYFHEQYNAYITPKMFRTWYGNKHLFECLRNMFNNGKLTGQKKAKLNIQEKNEIIKECGIYVSEKLNNTPTVSKQSYIDNKILDLVIKNPYKFASNIPDNSNEQHYYLYKIISQLRH